MCKNKTQKGIFSHLAFLGFYIISSKRPLTYDHHISTLYSNVCLHVGVVNFLSL